MRSRTSKLGLEAGEWLLDLEDREPDADEPPNDPARRQEEFFRWVTRSPEHARMFLETAETWHRLARLDAPRLIEIRELMENRTAEVIHLYGTADRAAADARKPSQPSRKARRIAAGLAVIGVLATASVLVSLSGPHTYTTAIGRQKTQALPDGSVVYLNTDSRVQVDFSDTHRRIDLIQGEALFVVARDTARPFTVQAGDTAIRALGTQFNVRRHPSATEIAVVEGAVQVVSTDNAATRLNAGEEAKVFAGTVRKDPVPLVADAVSWREGRLVFRDTPLSEIADEFNRYNRNKIRIEGEAARSKLMTGVFDADRPESLIAYTSRDASLSVRADGDDWIIGVR